MLRFLTLLSFIIFHLSFSPAKAQDCPARTQKIGLALSGGGAKGAATVGVLKVLEEAGLRPDYIAGTSIGAIVGGLYAAGYTASELGSIFCEQQWMSLLTDRREDLSGEPYHQEGTTTYIFGFPVIDTNLFSDGFGALRGGRIEQVLDSLLAAKGCVEFQSLPIPFCCVAAEWNTAHEVVLKDGLLPRALRASMAIPGLYKPVTWQGMQLIDGGMMNNLPVDVVRQMGADIVIAVDLQQEKPVERPVQDSPLTYIADLLGIGGMVDWILNRPDIKKYNANWHGADIYINPLLLDYDVTSFSRDAVEQMILEGEETARRQWKELRAAASPARR